MRFRATEMPMERFVLPRERRCDCLEFFWNTRRCQHEAIVRVPQIGMKLCGNCYLNLARIMRTEEE